MQDLMLQGVVDVLAKIEKDFSVPKNVRIKIGSAVAALINDEKNIKVRIDKSLQELDDIGDDPNVPSYTRIEVWNVVSVLESL